MPITRKPKVSSPAPLSKVDPMILIQRGGSTPSQATKKPYEGTTAVILRVPTEILGQVDQALESRPLRTPRHSWILEAIWEKLQREQDN